MSLSTTLQVIIEGRDNFSAAAGRVQGSVRNLESSAGRLGGTFGKAGVAVGSFGGALGHAGGKIGGLLTGPLGLIGLSAGVLSVGGAVEHSVKKISEFGLSLEKVMGLTGETALASGALILEFEKFGLGADRVAQIAGFAEKTLGKLNEAEAKGAKGAKSAALAQLEHSKALIESVGGKTKAINLLIREQKARDALNETAAGTSKLVAIDKAYGLNLVDAKGKVVDFSTELSQLATFYESNATASQKAFVAAQLLGRGYAAMIPILKAGPAAIRDAANAAKSLGLDQPGTVEMLAKNRTAMRDLGEQVNILQLQIGMKLVPKITEAAKAFSGWLSGGGSKQIVDFFASAAAFAGEFGHAIETFVVPGFKAIASAWGAIPGPLKDLLIGGFVANKAGKFLFDKSLVGGIKGLLGGALGKVPVVGGVLDSAAGVQHVWVDNMGLGMGGNAVDGALPKVVAAAGGAGALAVAGGLAVMAALTVGLALILDKAINDKGGYSKVTKDLKGVSLGTNIITYDPSFSGIQRLGGKGGGMTIVGTKPPGGPLGVSGTVAASLATAGDKQGLDYSKQTAYNTGSIAKGILDLHGVLAKEFHLQGGKVLREAAAKGNREIVIKARDLLQLFSTSKAPSLRSMKENLGVLSSLRGGTSDKPTRVTLGRDISDLGLSLGAKIVASGESQKQKTSDLAHIMAQLKANGQTEAARQIAVLWQIVAAVKGIPSSAAPPSGGGFVHPTATHRDIVGAKVQHNRYGPTAWTAGAL